MPAREKITASGLALRIQASRHRRRSRRRRDSEMVCQGGGKREGRPASRGGNDGQGQCPDPFATQRSGLKSPGEGGRDCQGGADDPSHLGGRREEAGVRCLLPRPAGDDGPAGGTAGGSLSVGYNNNNNNNNDG